MFSGKRVLFYVVAWELLLAPFPCTRAVADAGNPAAPALRNGGLTEWKDDRLAEWKYIPWSALKVNRTEETLEDQPVVEIFHPELGFLEQEFAKVDQVRPGDMLYLKAGIKAAQGDMVSLSFRLQYDKDGKSTYKTIAQNQYSGKGEWQKVEVVWKVEEEDLKDASSILVHLEITKPQSPVKVAAFDAWVENLGLSQVKPAESPRLFLSQECRGRGCPCEDTPCARL